MRTLVSVSVFVNFQNTVSSRPIFWPRLVNGKLAALHAAIS